jgi:hypothetical protein
LGGAALGRRACVPFLAQSTCAGMSVTTTMQAALKATIGTNVAERAADRFQRELRNRWSHPAPSQLEAPR